MGDVPFCTCTDHKCPNNPVNHDRGCTPCIAKCLHQGERSYAGFGGHDRNVRGATGRPPAQSRGGCVPDRARTRRQAGPCNQGIRVSRR